MIPTITRDTLKSLIDSDRSLTLIECLPEKYFAAEHLPGAIHIPHDEIATRAGMLIPNQHEPIVVYCANAQCQNSHIAAQVLKRLGYTDIRLYVGGKADWKAGGLAMESEMVQVG